METKEQLQTAPEVPVIADAPEQDSTPTWKAPKKKRRWPKVVIAVLLVLAALFFFVIRPMLGAGKELLAGAYLTSTAQMQEMTVSVSSTGTIQPIDSYNVSGMVTGEVLEAPFEVGDQVEKGDVLYRIDPGSAETALQQAQLSVQQAQLNYDSIVDGLNPKASGAGVVQKLHVKKGDLVSAGSLPMLSASPWAPPLRSRWPVRWRHSPARWNRWPTPIWWATAALWYAR